MGPKLFLNGLQELYLNFFPEPVDKTRNLTYTCVLWLLLLLFCFLVGIPSTPTCWENGHTRKHQGRAKRRRKGGTQKGSRYYHRKEEKNRRLNSILKRPLGQHHDTICFHQHLCPDPSREMYNNTTTELSRLPLSEALEDSPPSVSPLASTAPVTQPSFTQSPASSADPPGELIPPPLPEALLPTPCVLLPNPGSPLGNILSPSPLGQTLPAEHFPPLESKFPVHHPPPQPKDSFSSKVAQCHLRLEFPALQSTKTSFAGDAAAKLMDLRRLLFLSPDEQDSVQQYSYPKTREDHLKQKLVQLFWGLPSLHSESLSSAIPVLGDYSSIFIFNSISNASTGQESPMLPYFLPPSLLAVQPQPLPQTLPQSQPLPFNQIHPQARLQPPLPILPSSPIPQNRACGVQFHGPQNELECLTSSEIQCLEWNVLQKKQESLWGLPSVVQKSREDFCPSAPTFPQHHPCKACVSVSIDTVDFPLSSELREKFEHHLRKRLIQHRWGLPHRIHESLSLMRPRNQCSGKCESKSSYGLSWISEYKSQSSQPGSFHEWGPEMFQQEEDKGTDEGHSRESDPKDLLRDSEGSADKDVGSESEKDLAMKSRSEENSAVSGQSESPRELEKALQVHLSKKFEEINEGQLPGTVHGSWHTIETLPVKSNDEIKQRKLPPSVDGDYCLSTSQELSFLESSTQQMLEAHITKLRIGMLWGLPAKVLESIEIFKLKDTSSHSSFDPHSSSSTNLTSKMNSKSGGTEKKLLRNSSKFLHREKVGTENSVSVLNSPLSASSLVGKEGQGTLRQSSSDIKHGLREEIQRTGGARQTLLPVTNSVSGKVSQRHFPIANIHPPELPARQAGGTHEPEDKNMSSSDRAEMQLDRNTEEKEPASMSNMSREIVEAEELSAAQYKTSDSLTTNKPGDCQRINVNKTAGTIDLASDFDPKSSDFNSDELKSKMEKRKNRQTQGQPTDMSHDTNKASVPAAQGASRVDMGASHVLHVHLGDRTVSVEKQLEPWVPKQALRLRSDKNFPPAAKKVSPTGSKSQELGGGDAGLVTSQPGRNRVPTQVAFKETVWSRSPQTLSEKRQSPPDSLFINKMKRFFQRLQPGLMSKKQENPQVKGSPRSSAQSRGPVRSRAAFMGPTETQKALSGIGKFPEERLGPRHAGDTSCPQEPLPWAVRFEIAQQRTAAWARAEPVLRPRLNPRAPACGQSCCQAAVLAGQSPTSIIYTRNEGRHPQKFGALKNQGLYHQHPESVSHRGTVTHHPSPTCRPHPAQGPPAALTSAEGTVFRRPCMFTSPKVLL